MKKHIATQNGELPIGAQPQIKVDISISETIFTEKPTKLEIKKLRWSPANTSLQEILNHAASGKSFTCAIFKDNIRKAKNFIKQQVFCVDFDGGMTLTEAEEILKENNLFYNGGYYSFSHSAELEKFRLLFVFDGEIRSPELSKEILRGFYYLFQYKSDKLCIDASRYWNGTNKDYFTGDENQVINLKHFQEITNPMILATDRNQWRSIVIADEGVICAETGKLIYNINKDSQFCTKTDKKEIEKVSNVKLEDLLTIQIFKTFYEGKGTDKMKNKLTHHELFGVATNLIHLEGGSNIWKRCLAKNPNYSKDKGSIYNYVYHEKYQPIHFESFSPFEEDRKNFFQTFIQLNREKGKVYEYPNEDKVWRLSDAREELCLRYKEILDADDCNVYILKCATGLGKTQLIKNTQNIVAAFPDHDLKLEHYTDSSLSNDIKLATPAAEGFSDRTQKHIANLYKYGFNTVVNTLIKNLAEGIAINDGEACNPSDIDIARKYLDALQAVKQSSESNTVFTTHQRAVLTSFPQRAIIFDENPLGTLLQTGNIPVNDIKTLIAGLILIGQHELGEKLRICINSDAKIVHDFTGILIDESKVYNLIKTLKIKSKIWEFLKSDYYVKLNDKVNYCTNNLWRLPIDKKIIIADATAPVELYRKILGDRLKVIDISNVELKGKIIQYTNRSCSRTGNKKYGTKVSADLDEWGTITFKSQKDMFGHSALDIHFGKCRGTNKYEGKNLNVVGTPNYGGAFYMLLAKVCGLDVNGFTMDNIDVLYKNKGFVFYTFKNEELQKFHLELSEGDIIQAAHRARPINHDVTVKVYSNLPIPHAQLKWREKNSPESNKKTKD